MQKKLIAVAVAGLMSGAAFAQSNVTIYGSVDIGYEHASGSGLRSNGINSGTFAGSKIGFKGEEALGNGMKVDFQLEYGLNADANSGINNGARVQSLGLSGGFGAFHAGNVYTPANDYECKYDSMGCSNAFSVAQAFSQNNSGLTALSVLAGVAHQNTIRYDAPAMGGFTLKGAYSFAGDLAGGASDQTAYSGDQERFYDLGVDYDMGPLSIGAFYARTNDHGNASNVDSREYGLGVTYDFGMAKVVGRWDRFRDDALNNNKRLLSLGVSIPVGTNNKLSMQYANLADKENNRADSRGYGIQFEHPLSKRTFAYAGYTHMSNDGNANANVPNGTGNGVSGSLNGLLNVGDSSSGYGFGMVHSF